MPIFANSLYIIIIPTQPILIYIVLVTHFGIFGKTIFIKIPIIANPQIIPNIDHPKGSLIIVRHIGVYVPAINRNIAK